jgi:hypothetical protein
MLTGKTRYRLSWRKKMILQVEHWCRSSSYPNPYHRTYSAHWFDATFQDVMDLQAGKTESTKPADEYSYPPKRHLFSELKEGMDELASTRGEPMHHRKHRDAAERRLSREGIDYKWINIAGEEE